MRKKPLSEKEQLPPLSDRDRDYFLAAFDRPARLMPAPIRKAKVAKASLVVSDIDKNPKNGQ